MHEKLTTFLAGNAHIKHYLVVTKLHLGDIKGTCKSFVTFFGFGLKHIITLS